MCFCFCTGFFARFRKNSGRKNSGFRKNSGQNDGKSTFLSNIHLIDIWITQVKYEKLEENFRKTQVFECFQICPNAGKCKNKKPAYVYVHQVMLQKKSAIFVAFKIGIEGLFVELYRRMNDACHHRHEILKQK